MAQKASLEKNKILSRALPATSTSDYYYLSLLIQSKTKNQKVK